jgi:hypothetical protein
VEEKTMEVQQQTNHRRAANACTRRQSVEFWLYFYVIFLTALPIACVRWVVGTTLGGAERARTPIGEARAIAYEVVPHIFMV